MMNLRQRLRIMFNGDSVADFFALIILIILTALAVVFGLVAIGVFTNGWGILLLAIGSILWAFRRIARIDLERNDT